MWWCKREQNGQGAGRNGPCPRARRHRRGRCAETADWGRTLLDCVCRQSVVIRRIAPSVTCAARLRELGIMEGATVLVLRQSDPLLLLAQDCRIALDLSTADGIEVEAAEPETPASDTCRYG